MKILTLYFSKSGHTRKMAEEIHDAIGGDLGEIRTKKKYSSSYGISVLQVGVEKMIGRMPELEEDEYRAEDYDVILLGGPTWYYTIASAVQVWIKNHDLKGKGCIPSVPAEADRRIRFPISGRWQKKAEQTSKASSMRNTGSIPG